MLPTIPGSEVYPGAFWKMLPPPTRLTTWYKLTQRSLVKDLRLHSKQTVETLGCEAEGLYRFPDFVGVGIHGVRAPPNR